MMTIDVHTIKKVEKELGSFRNKTPTVLTRALNRAAQNAKTNAVRKVREQYQVKAKDIRDTIKITKANKSTLGAIVKSTGYRIPLNKFKVNPANPRPKNPPKVLKVAVKKDGLKELLGAFVADINGSKVFRRTTSKRLPIELLYGPAVPQMLGNVSVKDFIENEAAKVFEQRLNHEINRALEGNK